MDNFIAKLGKCKKCGGKYQINHQSPDCPYERLIDLMPKELLTDEELNKVKFNMGSPWGLVDRYTVGRAIMEDQYDKDNAPNSQIRKDERKRIFDFLENDCDHFDRDWYSFGICEECWQALKQGELPLEEVD